MKVTLLAALAGFLLLNFIASVLSQNELTTTTQDEAEDSAVSLRSTDDDNEELSAQEKNEKMAQAGVAFGGAMAALIGIASAGTGGVLAAGIAIVGYFLSELTKKQTTLWQQIETKVELKIGEKLAEYHVERLRAEVFRVLEGRFEDPEGFSHADLKITLDKRHLVFPHNWPSLGWSYELPLGILYWMPFMIAGYQQLIKDGSESNCALANELARTRANVITSMKEMLRKRYRQVHGTKYSYDRVNYPCRKKKAHKKASKRRLGGFGGRKTECVSIDRLMTWDDGLSGKSFTIRKRNTGFVGNNFNTEINKIRDNAVDFLWKEVIEKVNKFFDPEICLETLGCSCPSKIQKREISFNFPSACIANGAEGTCLHPCDSFDYSYDWCWINRNPDQWSKCTQPDLNDCMPVTVPPIDYPNVLPAAKAKELA